MTSGDRRGEIMVEWVRVLRMLQWQMWLARGRRALHGCEGDDWAGERERHGA